MIGKCIFGELIAAILLDLGGFFINQGELLIVLIDLAISSIEKYYVINAFEFNRRCLSLSLVLYQISLIYYSLIVWHCSILMDHKADYYL